jgi:hypothetical protein
MAGNDPEFGTAGGCAKIHGRVMLRRMLVTDELAAEDMGSLPLTGATAAAMPYP